MTCEIRWGRHSACRAIGVLLSVVLPLFAQTTVGTGNIVGTVNDPSRAVVSGAQVTITNVATGQLIHLIANPLGFYNSGALVPGEYRVRVSAEGFSSVELSLTVLVGNTASANVSLQLGSKTQVIQVQDSALRVNTERDFLRYLAAFLHPGAQK